MFIKCPRCGAENMENNNFCVSCHKPLNEKEFLDSSLFMDEEKKYNDGLVITIIAIYAIITGLIAGLLLKLDSGLKLWVQSHYGLFILGLFCFYFIFCYLTILIIDKYKLKKKNMLN